MSYCDFLQRWTGFEPAPVDGLVAPGEEGALAGQVHQGLVDSH